MTKRRRPRIIRGRTLVKKFDRMGRRVEYIEAVRDDATDSVATRPLFMQQRNPVGDPSNYFFTHDGNKNVSDVVSYQRARGVVAHYDYTS